MGKSLFYYKGGPKKCHAQRIKYYCTCQGCTCNGCCGNKRTVKCDYSSFAKRPKYRVGTQGWKNLNFPGGKHCGKRKRRSTSDDIILPDDELELGDYVYNPGNITARVPTWPTPTGKSEASTRRHCENALRNSEVGKACLKLILGLDLTPFIEECLEDVQVRYISCIFVAAV